MTQQKQTQNWQNIIWREWKNCNDEAYAEYLFDLVVDEKTDEVTTTIPATIAIFFGIMWAVGGLLVGLSVSLITTSPRQTWINSLYWLVWSAIGGGAGCWMWLMLKQYSSWRIWLKRLAPNIVTNQFIEGGLNWLEQRLFFGLILGLTGSLVGLTLEFIVGQGTIGLGAKLGLVGSLVGLMGISLSLIFGLTIGHRDGLILGTIGWLNGWLGVGLIFILADWGTIGMVSILICALAMLPSLISFFIDASAGASRPQIEISKLIYFLVIGGLGFGLSLVGQLTVGRQATLNAFEFLGIHLVKPTPQLNGMLGLIGWISAGLGAEVGVLLSIFRSRPDNDKIEYEYRRWFFWWKNRPCAPEVKAALTQACQMSPARQKFWSEVMDRLARKQQLDSPQTLIDCLQDRDWVERFVAGQALVVMGGKAIIPLGTLAIRANKPLKQTAAWILHSIESETTDRLAPQAANLLCADCIKRCGPIAVQISQKYSFNYYGCRACGQSREFWDCTKGVAAVLDADMAAESLQQDGLVWVNWLARRTLFDFDWIEIIQATDEEVERFAVQVGNDTDPSRQPCYKQMRCVIAPTCLLSKNTLRILRHTFGQVGRRKKLIAL